MQTVKIFRCIDVGYRTGVRSGDATGIRIVAFYAGSRRVAE